MRCVRRVSTLDRVTGDCAHLGENALRRDERKTGSYESARALGHSCCTVARTRLASSTSTEPRKSLSAHHRHFRPTVAVPCSPPERGRGHHLAKTADSSGGRIGKMAGSAETCPGNIICLSDEQYHFCLFRFQLFYLFLVYKIRLAKASRTIYCTFYNICFLFCKIKIALVK